MGEAKRKKQAKQEKPFWAWFPPCDYGVVAGLTLDEALNFADYYTVEQAIKAAPHKLPWEINRMVVSNKRYECVKRLCLRTGFLNVGHVDAGACVKWAPNIPSNVNRENWDW